MSHSLAAFRAAYDDPYAAARAHRSGGGKVVGYFLNSVPEELIVAAGLFPVRLRGEPSQRSALADRYMEEYMDGEVRSIFGALLEGYFDFLDLIVIPRNSEVYLQLYYFLLDMRKWEPNARVPPIYLFDLLQTPSSTTLKYVSGRIDALADRLEAIGERLISDKALAAAIAQTNAKRALLQRVSSHWVGSEPRISGTDALAIVSCASFLEHEAFCRQLDALLSETLEPQGSAPRLMLKGSPQSDLRFTSLVEQLGGRVVAHDHLWGDRTYRTLVDENESPRTALARHYCFNIPSPREYPQAQADERFVELARQSHVSGVIFYHDEWDDTLGWEYPNQKQQLDALGIPSLFLKRQPYFDPPQNEQRRAVREFLNRVGNAA